MDIPLHSTPRFRYKVRHPFRAKVHQYSAGKVTISSFCKVRHFAEGTNACSGLTFRRKVHHLFRAKVRH
jgi:hypothetical protein